MDIKVPAVGESINEATIGEWVKKSGDFVERDEIILVLETDKASVEVVAEANGKLETKVEEGETVDIGTVVASLDTSAAAPKGKTEAPGEASEKTAETPAQVSTEKVAASASSPNASHLSPAVRRVVSEAGIDPSSVQGTGRGGRLTKGDVLQASAGGSTQLGTKAKQVPTPKAAQPAGTTERVPMTTLRKKVAERLVMAQQTAAILTTFNEVDMTNLMALRAEYKEPFEKKYGIRLGFMGFFVKAAMEALTDFPAVNAFVDGTDMIFHNYFNVGIAVSSPKGLVVPVLKNAQDMSLADIEQGIRNYALKARDGKITIDDMSGGTFTISNGGVFGSLMSTPILNPPQSAILGMHKIEKRPVVVGDEVKIRQMMYLALSYDHRMIDGKESVSFLVRIKECIEDPTRMLMHI